MDEQDANDQATIREAMRILGRSRSAKKIAALNANRAKLQTDENRAKLRQAQQARRQREREENAALDVVPKRGRPGRPKKADALPTSAEGQDTP